MDEAILAELKEFVLRVLRETDDCTGVRDTIDEAIDEWLDAA